MVYHDTFARTRTDAIRLWREPLGDDGWYHYERGHLKGIIRTVKVYATADLGATP